MCSSTCFPLLYFHSELSYITNESACRSTWFHSIIGLVVEFVVAIDEARVRFTDDAHLFFVFVVESTEDPLVLPCCGAERTTMHRLLKTRA